MGRHFTLFDLSNAFNLLRRTTYEEYLDHPKIYCSESLLHHMFVLTKWWNNNSWALSCAMSTQLRKIKHKKRANVYIISPLFYFRNKKSMLLYYMVVLLRIFLLLWRGKYIERNIAMVRAKRVVICCSRNKNKVDSPWRPIPATLNLFLCTPDPPPIQVGFTHLAPKSQLAILNLSIYNWGQVVFKVDPLWKLNERTLATFTLCRAQHFQLALIYYC